MYGYYSWTASSTTQGAESQNAEISVDLGQTSDISVNLGESSAISVNLGESTSLVAYITNSGAIESSATAATNDIKKHAANKTALSSPYNLLSLLATAQDKQVDFLPITWDEATSDRGGQASISQSFFQRKAQLRIQAPPPKLQVPSRRDHRSKSRHFGNHRARTP
ncbi:hypothetical protein TGAMA5MH_10304 [Trichoderma gamsii]|uniref:Uncharacterized protein n=1 Tax=Trichoderma gamsii TaxID=398673 RepID=A0A2K0SX23_9HYPO|nr:hypothetical protein TGAMA5MH_10304 [Trichoderma gamsii]